MSGYEFGSPWYLLLLLLIPIIWFWRQLFATRTDTHLNIPSIKAYGATAGWYRYIHPAMRLLQYMALALLIIALARPRKVDVSSAVKSQEGIDIMLVVDVSLSMLARDLKPNRLAALQRVAEDFAVNRPHDRIGLVVYSGEGVTKVPLTTDRNMLVNQIRNLRTDELEPGTAIGIGLATAVNHLQHSTAKSKVVLLMSDGGESPVDYSTNRIYVSPEDAAKIAMDKSVKVYTIGIGTTGYILLPRGYEHYPQNLFQIDEELLQYIARVANGAYFRATDNQTLQQIYERINQLERTEISDIKYYNYSEYYRYFVAWAFFFLLLEIFLRTKIFRQLNT